MRILHIGKYYPPYYGGIEKVNFDLVESLNNLGYRTDVLCFNDSNISTSEMRRYRIDRKSVLFKLLNTPISISLFYHLFNYRNNYDIIHIHTPNPIGSLALLFINFKGKIVIHWHSDIINQIFSMFFFIPFQFLLLKKATRIVVTSSDYLKESKDLRKFHFKCTVIPIGINKLVYFQKDQSIFSKIQSFSNKKIIFSLGRLVNYKGFEYLINSAKIIPNNYQILIGGDGPDFEKLNSQIINNNFCDKVILLRNLSENNKLELYKRCDVFCLPSINRAEAFGVVLIEAQSFGCAIVTTNIKGSGILSIIKHNYNGLIVEPQNSVELANAFMEIINNKNLSLTLRSNSIKEFNEKFKLQDMTKKVADLYDNILQ